MIKDITFGQFIDTNSVIHKLDPRTKLVLLICFMVFLLFFVKSFLAMGIFALFVLVLMFVSKIPVTMYLKNIKTILPIIILTVILNTLYTADGVVLLKFWIFTITVGGLTKAFFMTARIILLILASALLSYTTSPTSLTGAIESLLKPLSLIGLKNAVHIMAMTMTIALRFIPTLIDETNKIMNAQKARGADLESGNIIRRIKALIPILVPLLISSVRRAYELSDAMECRCYSGSSGRTKYRIMKYKVGDAIALAVFLIVAAISIIL